MNALEAKYGLPDKVKFCKKCVISNQRWSSEVEFKHNIKTKKKTINFDNSKICDACRHAENKEDTNWNIREEELLKLLSWCILQDFSFFNLFIYKKLPNNNK